MSVQSSTAPEGTDAPDFTLPDAEGGELTLSSLRPTPVVLVFLRGFA